MIFEFGQKGKIYTKIKMAATFVHIFNCYNNNIIKVEILAEEEGKIYKRLDDKSELVFKSLNDNK